MKNILNYIKAQLYKFMLHMTNKNNKNPYFDIEEMIWYKNPRTGKSKAIKQLCESSYLVENDVPFETYCEDVIPCPYCGNLYFTEDFFFDSDELDADIDCCPICRIPN